MSGGKDETNERIIFRLSAYLAGRGIKEGRESARKAFFPSSVKKRFFKNQK